MRTLAKTLSLFSAIFMLTACGGGGSVSRDDTDNGSGNGDGGTTTPTYSVSLTLENTSGESDNNLTEENSLFAVASVVDQDGNLVSDKLVTFALSNSALATFGNDTATASTNESGIARIGLNASTASGDGEITASLSSGESGTTTFSATAIATGATENTVTLTLQNSDGEEDNNLSTNSALTAVATVKDADGNPLDDILLTFSLSNGELAEFSNDTATALTDEAGIASIGMTVSDLSGDGEVIVTLPSGESDSTTFSSTGRTSVSEQPASLELFADSIQLASSGSDEVELIALVKNEQSVLMEGVEVSFSAPSTDGVELQLIQTTTAADGTARALLSTRNNAANRIVTVSAQAGSLSPQNVAIEIDGTEVTVNGASSVILNDTVDYTIRVQDSDGTSILNQPVSLSASGGVLGTTEVNTGSTGQATVSYTASESGENTITATALNASATFTLQVQQDEFNFVNLPTEEVPVGQQQAITVQWRQNNAPVVGENITFSASRGAINGASTVATNADGEATISISSTNAGISSITATASDANGDVLVSALTQIEFVATTPHTLIADASPDLLGPDGQTSTISAVVRDVDGNLVKNSVINFTVSDVSTGFVSPSQATTDSKGIATTVFTSGSVSTPDAVVITAFVADDPSIEDDVVLTVGNRAFDISIGTGNELEEPTSTTYLKRFSVFVSDSVGQPVSGVELTASVTPVKFVDGGEYRTGFWVYNDDESIWQAVVNQNCETEDVNDNGILDTTPRDEDTNGDDMLTPGSVGTITFAVDSVTDENGYAELEYRYPASYAVWYDAVISVFGQSTGSEAKASMRYTLSISADDVTDEGSSPPANPFGVTDQCTEVTP